VGKKTKTTSTACPQTSLATIHKNNKNNASQLRGNVNSHLNRIEAKADAETGQE